MNLGKIGLFLGRAIDFLARKIVWLSALGVLAVFVLVVVDVVGRYFFNHPVKGSNDIGELMLVGIAYFAMAFTQLHKEHVRVTLVWGKLPKKVQQAFDCAAYLFGAAIWALIAWNLAVRIHKLLAGTYASSSESPVLGIPHLPFLFVAVVGAIAFALLLLADSIRAIEQLRRPATQEAGT